jgi:hypothetical protein
MTKTEKDSSPIDRLENMAGAAKEYLDMRMDALKLQLVENLSRVFSRLISIVLLFFFLGIAVAFSASAFSWWITDFLGSKIYGDLVTCGLFLFLAFLIYIKRKNLFVDSMIKVFISLFFEAKSNLSEEDES